MTNSMVMVTVAQRVGSEEMGPDRIAQKTVPRRSSTVEINFFVAMWYMYREGKT